MSGPKYKLAQNKGDNGDRKAIVSGKMVRSKIVEFGKSKVFPLLSFFSTRNERYFM